MQVLCDNEAVVTIVNKGTTKDTECMHLVECLAFIKAKFNVDLVASHIKGKLNTLADALSRNFNKVSCSAPTGSRGARRDTSPIARSSAGTEARLDIPELGTAVEFYFHNGLADSTRKTYASAQKKFKEFCSEQGLLPASASEPTLCHYVAHLAQGGTAHSSINVT